MKYCLIFIVAFFFSSACKKSGSAIGRNTVPSVDTITTDPAGDTSSGAFFAKGADISWLTQMESSGTTFRNNTGAEQELLQLLKELGMNTMRLRVWVNPAGNYNSSADVLAKAIRVKNAGMKLMIDFHYSDTWADPGHQEKPAAWASQDITGLQSSIREHTSGVLNLLQANGITPEWVQVGNETNDGMLWPQGKASVSMANFALLVKAGYNAVKSVNDTIKVIVHISNGYDNSLFRWMFDGLKSQGVKWDMIGMSLYPTATNWPVLNEQCLSNMKDMVTRYNTDVMIVEAGMSWDQPAASNAFLTDLISKTKSVSQGKGRGVLYWEPQAFNNWQGYSLGAFDNSGKPTIALDAFK